MTTGSSWFVNKPADLESGDLGAYLDAGRWRCPDPGKHREALASMRTGDPIALKSVQTRAADLPFFSADRPASVMTIIATGSVTSVDAGTGDVGVAWNRGAASREWFLWTNMRPLWRVQPEGRPFAQALVDFAFEGKPQDLEAFLADPYWSARYSPWPGLSWIGFYEEFATRLLAFREDRAPLVDLLRGVAEEEPLLGYLSHDKPSASEFGPMRDVDPFTVLGAFNRGTTWENRRGIAARLGTALGVGAAPPEDFDGIPVLNNQNSWFMSYEYKRKADDIERLWAAFAAGIRLADEGTPDARGEFVSAYDRALDVRGVRWNLSTGLYWVRPGRFMTLDSRSRALLAKRYAAKDPSDASEYLALCDRLQAAFASPRTSITSFPLLSYAAWRGDGAGPTGHSVAAFASWAARFDDSVDLESVEHAYKRKAASLAAMARDQARSGDPEWPATFRKALNATNTIDFRFKDTLGRGVTADPSGGLAVLETVWSAAEPGSLDALQAALATFLGKVTPGNATALGALLLMADDPESNAPYSPKRTERWYHLAGWSRPEPGASATSRYRTMLDFLDAIREHLDSRPDTLEPTRLEVQGMAWATSEATPPESWDDSERAALLEWRGDAMDDARAWLARSTTEVADWIDDGYVSMAASYLGALPPGSTLPEVKDAIESGYLHQDYSQRKALADEYYAFLTLMKAGDVVAAINNATLHVGIVEGGPHYVEDGGDRLRRSVSWRSAVPVGELTTGLTSLMDRQGSIVDITEALDELQAVLDGPSRTVTRSVESLPAATPELAEELHMPIGSLQEILDLLASRKQIVLYGPPGTGKTFVAKALARHIIGPDDPSRMQLVQFHPSYAYEDFFEGYRPDVKDGQATFSLQAGPLARIALAARSDRSHPYVLVIDEMNRANLAKVFGELYFLLEYRGESIQLQYRPAEAFRIPENLFIIGTMNTADRSIAMLDAAMRRRFSFVELHPDEEPVKGVLPAWLESGNHSQERAVLLQALNAAIEDQDRDLRIGPSYLMRAEAATDEGLERIWKHDIMPLLEEHYYGRLSRDQIHARFGLAAIRASGAKAQAPAGPGAVEPDELFEEDAGS